MVKRRIGKRRSKSNAPASVAGVLASIVLAGCTGGVALVTIDDVMDPQKYRFEEQDLTASKLAKRMKEIDEQYSETRTTKKVELSLETAELSISRANDYAALWRGARACHWLATNANLPLEEREEYALKGYAMSRRCQEDASASTQVEPWYYGALNIGAYCSLRHQAGSIPSSRLLRKAKEWAKVAWVLDETFDYAGPHRFLGKIIVETSGSLTHEIGSFEEGLGHLRRAVELSPEYAENHLFLAEALAEDGEDEAAREALEKVLRSRAPPDHSVEHDAWMKEATALLARLSPEGGDAGTVDVSAFDLEEAGEES